MAPHGTVLRNNARDNFYEALALRHMPSPARPGQTTQRDGDGDDEGSGRARLDCSVAVWLQQSLGRARARARAGPFYDRV